jgi:hypothetical protein
MNIRLNPSLAISCLMLAAALPATVLAGGEPSPPNARHMHAKPAHNAGQKPGSSGVVVRFELGAAPQPGQPTPVILQFDGVTAPEGATVRLSPDKGLHLQGAAMLTLPQGRPSTATVLVVSEREGLAYLNLFVSQGAATSAISIPIQTGSSISRLKSTGELKSTPDGERIITLPVK